MEEGHIAYSDTSIEGLENTKIFIRDLLYKGKYTEANFEMNIFYRQIKRNKSLNAKDCLWFCCYNKAWICFKLKEYKKALRYAKKSNLYIDSYNDKIKTMWMIIDSKEKLNENNLGASKENKKFFLSFAQQYKGTSEIILRILVLAKGTEIEKNVKRMFRLLKILEKVDDSKITYIDCAEDMTKENVTKTILNEVLNLCIENKNIAMINKIKQHFRNNRKMLSLILSKLKENFLLSK